MRKILPILIACIAVQWLRAGSVEFTQWRPQGDYQAIERENFTIRLPKGWSVVDRKDKDGSYSVLDKKKKKAFDVTVVEGGPRFIECFCTPKKEYEHTDYGAYEIWSVRLADGAARTWKVAKGNLRLDIHAVYGDFEKGMIDYIIESARPKPKTHPVEDHNGYPITQTPERENSTKSPIPLDFTS